MDTFSLGIGFLCSDIKFHVSVQKSATAACGYRINRFIRWRSHIKQQQKNTKNMFSVLTDILDKLDLPLQQRYHNGKDVKKFMDFIETTGLDDYLSDRDGYLLMAWVLDNPIPSNFEDFIAWAEDFEASAYKDTKGDL